MQNINIFALRAFPEKTQCVPCNWRVYHIYASFFEHLALEAQTSP